MIQKLMIAATLLWNIGLPLNGCAQGASIVVAMADSSAHIFKVTVVNKSYEKYWIQDTSLIKALVAEPGRNFIYPFVERKNNGKYKHYGQGKFSSFPVPDTCSEKCCNCIYLNKGESINFYLPLLKGYELKKGDYRVQVGMHPPLMSCKGCKQLEEIVSNYVYFKVR